jgi:uncharacterized protein with HEPN domain
VNSWFSIMTSREMTFEEILNEIAEYGGFIQSRVHGKGPNDLSEDEMTAVEGAYQRVGRGAKYLLERRPDVSAGDADLKELVGCFFHIIHEYHDIDRPRFWNAVTVEVPKLVRRSQELLLDGV